MEEVGNDECDTVSSEVETSQAVYEFNTCQMNARNVRQIYLITYSMVDTKRFPTRSSFAEAVGTVLRGHACESFTVVLLPGTARTIECTFPHGNGTGQEPAVSSQQTIPVRDVWYFCTFLRHARKLFQRMEICYERRPKLYSEWWAYWPYKCNCSKNHQGPFYQKDHSHGKERERCVVNGQLWGA